MSFANPRGELRIKHILERLFDTVLMRHVPVHTILSREKCKNMTFGDHEVDLWMPTRLNVFEVNYGHGNRAQQKEDNLRPHLQDAGIHLIPIEARECPKLFADNHTDSWDDFIEVIQELKRNNINEKGEKIK